jgi:hypothetical protein
MSQNRSEEGFAILVASKPDVGFAQPGSETRDDKLANVNDLLNSPTFRDTEKVAIAELLRKSYEANNLKKGKMILAAAEAKNDEQRNEIVVEEFSEDTGEAARSHDVEVLSRLLELVFRAQLHEGDVNLPYLPLKK